MKEKTVLYQPPEGPPYLKRVVVTGTKYVQDKKTGEMEGRKAVKSNGDKIKRNRVAKPFILVRRSKTAKGHIRQNREEHNREEFF